MEGTVIEQQQRGEADLFSQVGREVGVGEVRGGQEMKNRVSMSPYQRLFIDEDSHNSIFFLGL